VADPNSDDCNPPLTFVACVSDEEILRANLLASPCLGPGSVHGSRCNGPTFSLIPHARSCVSLRDFAYSFSGVGPLGNLGARTNAVWDSTCSPRSNPAIHYPDFPLSKYSAIANALQLCYLKLTNRPRTAQKQAVTERLIDEMDSLCRRNSADFAVIALTYAGNYLAHCKARGIACYEVAVPFNPDTMSILGDGHLNAALNDASPRLTPRARRLRSQVGRNQCTRCSSRVPSRQGRAWHRTPEKCGRRS
jgi:hypothetical protein